MRFSVACSLSSVLVLAGVGVAAAESGNLAHLLARIASSEGVEARFVESKELRLLAVPLETRGVIYFAPPGRFARFTLEPDFTALLVSGDDVRLREGRNATALDLGGNQMARVFVDNIVVLWSGDRDRLEERYSAEFRGDTDHWELRLVPRHDPLTAVIEAITLRGDAEAMREMRVDERDGDRTITRFHDVRSDRAFTPSELERIFVSGEPLPDFGTER